MRDPAATYAKMAATAQTKLHALWSAQLLQGVLAGAYVAVGAMSANLASAGFTGEGSKLIGGAVFPVGLIAIFLTGANLFTGNCMYVVPPLLNGAVHPLRALAFLVVSFVSNFAGAVAVAYFVGHLGEYFGEDPYASFVKKNAEHKCSYAWGVAFVRGIGANWLVCLGWWMALSTDDTISKAASIWWPVFTFTAIGFEHCIANMFYVVIGLLEGASASFGGFLTHNLVPVALGNVVGGSLLLGAVGWATYDRASPLVTRTESAESSVPLTINAAA